MRRVLTTVLAVALLLGLGALAVLALPNGRAPLVGAPAVSAAAPEFEPDAPGAANAVNKWNSFALPLSVTNMGINTAKNVANYINSGNADTIGNGSTQRIMKWDRVGQKWVEYYPNDPDLGDPDFVVTTGDALMALVDSALTNTVLSWVGDVPAQGTVTNSLSPNAYNFIMVPLDQYATYGSPSNETGTAGTLASDMTGVTRVMKWDSTAQRWIEYFVQDPDLGDPDFSVFAGYPYFVRADGTAPAQWP